MAIRSVHKYRRNTCQHEMFAKVGTRPFGIIYVSLETLRKRSKNKLLPGVRFKFRYENAWYADLMTGVVAEETKPGGTIFVTLL